MTGAVVVAGAGPTGLMLASELGLAGVPTVVIEPLPRPSPMAPGVAVNAGLVEQLDDRGLMDALREETFVLPAVHFALIWLDLTKQDEPHADAYMVPQDRLEQLLEDRAVELGVDIRRGHEVVGLDQGPDEVTVSVRSAAGEYRLPCSYLVGCDGKDSTVRALAGIGFPGIDDRDCAGIVADVEIDLDDTAPELFGAYLSSAGGVYMGAPSGPGRLRMMTLEWREPSPDRPAAAGTGPVTAAELRAAVRRTTGREPSTEPLWLSRYEAAVRQADRYRAGRVFVAGDAAHVMVPLNGLAMSCAIQDAANLGWKLAAAVHGWAPPGLLDSYHDERHPAGSRVCRDVLAQVALLHPAQQVSPLREVIGELLRFDVVQRHLIETVTGLGVRYPMGAPSDPAALSDPTAQPHPLLGRRLPQVSLRRADGELHVPELLHAGRAVLLDLSGGAMPTADMTGWKDRVDLVVAEPTPDIPATAVLLRPDGHVAWAGSAGAEDEGLAAALSRWFGTPAG